MYCRIVRILCIVHCSVLYCNVPSVTNVMHVLNYTVHVMYHSTLSSWSALYCTVLYCTELSCTVLYCTVCTLYHHVTVSELELSPEGWVCTAVDRPTRGSRHNGHKPTTQTFPGFSIRNFADFSGERLVMYTFWKKNIMINWTNYYYTVIRNHNLIVFEEITSLTALTWYIGMKTAIFTKRIKC